MRDERERPRRRKRRQTGLAPSTLYTIIGAVVFVVVVVLFIVFRQAFRRNPNPAPANDTTQNTSATTQPRPQTPKQKTAASKKSPSFVADAGAAAQLGEEAEIAGRRLRLPRGWIVHSDTPLERGQSVIWKDPAAMRDDNTAPQVQVTIINLTQEEMNDIGWKPGEIVKKSLNVETKDLLNVTRFPAEAGYINGVYGMRARWRGTNPNTRRVAHGVVYVFFDNLQMVVMAAGLTEPGHEAAIKLAEAAMLSIRRP